MYRPTARDLPELLASLSSACGKELAIPGNWSPQLFYSDLFDYPVESKEDLIRQMISSLKENWTYRKFFQESRKYSRSINSNELWDIFDLGCLMLVHENTFLILAKQVNVSETSLEPFRKIISEKRV